MKQNERLTQRTCCLRRCLWIAAFLLLLLPMLLLLHYLRFLTYNRRERRSVKRMGEVAQHVACHMPWVFFPFYFWSATVAFPTLAILAKLSGPSEQKKERESEREKEWKCAREHVSMAYPRTGGASWLPLHAAARPKPQPQQLQKKAAETSNKSHNRASPALRYPSHNKEFFINLKTCLQNQRSIK